MDTGAYPADSVKKFCEPFVLMHVDKGGGKDAAKMVKEFEVKALPTLIMLKPNGEILKKIEGGLETPDAFTGNWTTDLWNAYVNAQNAKPQDGKAMAEGLFPLTAWYAHSEWGKKAADAAKQAEANPDFKTRWAELKKQHELENWPVKAEAQLKLNKKKEAIETYKLIATTYPDEKQGKDAAAILKKMGVKMDAPADGGDKK